MAWSVLQEQLGMDSKGSDESVTEDQIPITNQSLEETNFISKISGYCQQHSYSLSYIEVKKEGPSHIPLFYYKLVIDKKDYPEAQGKTIKEAKQKATQMAWSVLQEQLGMDSKGSDESVTEDQIPITNQSLEETNFISKISGYCQQHSYSLSYIEVKKEGPSHIPLFYYKLVIDKKDYPEAQGKTIKEAKQKAAQMAWSVLQEQLGMDSKGSDESVTEDQIPITNQSLEETNFIPKISGYCQQHSYSLSYIEVKKEGPSHNPLFYYKLVIDKKDYPEAQGKNIKEAKQKAAQRAWSDITKHLSVDSKLSDDSSKSDESERSVRHGQSSSEESWMSSNSTVSPNVLDADMKRETGNGWRQSQFDSFEALGDGGFGWVFKARKKDLDKFFAIKEIKARDLKKSLHEAQVLADLLHTNIVRYYNSWLENTGYRWPNSQVLFIQMELCDGGTLRSWIYEKNKESMGMSRRNQSLQIAQQI
uniref:Interferon-induced double-stranded RNA-activated protein kinase n=1 Tax=Neogobius melanostomus TaxID=47308 RepID=A0A8C6SYF3_9GOBI